MRRYPNYIMKQIRVRKFGLASTDVSKDNEINEMKKEDIFRFVCENQGVAGCSEELLIVIDAIYGTNLRGA